LKKFLAQYRPGEPFAEEFVYKKQSDDPTKYVDFIAGTLEIIDGIEYLGSEMISDESGMAARTKLGQAWMPVEESRLDRIVMRFKITHADRDGGPVREEVIERELLYPKLLDAFHFQLNGVRYSPIWQVVDAETFRTHKGVTLKTMIMPVTLVGDAAESTSLNGTAYPGRCFKVRLFDKVVNVAMYFLISKGLAGTLDFFGLDAARAGMCLDADMAHMDPGYEYFRTAKGSLLYVWGPELESQHVRDVVACVLDACAGKATVDKAGDLQHWKRAAGALFTRNASAYAEKAERLTVSFERVLDALTRSVLRIPDEDKEDVYSAVRWMMREYDMLRRQDNMDLMHKRARLHEYLLYPLLIKWSNGVYRILNSKQVGFNDLRTLFSNLSPRLIVKNLLSNDLLRYSSAVNGIDLFNSALKFSMRGPQSVASGTRAISVRYRGIHESYVGVIGLNTSSNGDPGMSGTFTPFFNPERDLFFTEQPFAAVADGAEVEEDE
jgi:hypothetical protein